MCHPLIALNSGQAGNGCTGWKWLYWLEMAVLAGNGCTVQLHGVEQILVL